MGINGKTSAGKLSFLMTHQSLQALWAGDTKWYTDLPYSRTPQLLSPFSLWKKPSFFSSCTYLSPTKTHGVPFSESPVWKGSDFLCGYSCKTSWGMAFQKACLEYSYCKKSWRENAKENTNWYLKNDPAMTRWSL